jgi:hypothetical protein
VGEQAGRGGGHANQKGGDLAIQVAYNGQDGVWLPSGPKSAPAQAPSVRSTVRSVSRSSTATGDLNWAEEVQESGVQPNWHG